MKQKHLVPLWYVIAAFVLGFCVGIVIGTDSAHAAEPAPKLCSAINTALSNLLVIQATKTVAQLEQALIDMGMNENGRTTLAAEALKPETLRKIRAKYDPELQRQVRLILMLAGCS